MSAQDSEINEPNNNQARKMVLEIAWTVVLEPFRGSLFGMGI